MPQSAPSPAADPRWRIAMMAAIGAAAFAYVATRAVTLSVTYDEAATYLRYIQKDPGLIFRFDVATNHFLNTALVRLLYAIGGRHDVLLRLPNVVAFAGFLVWTARLLRRVRTPVIAVAAFALVVMNPYVLDFFSLSRGYGLGAALLIGALASAVDALEGGGSPALRRLAWRGSAAVLATFSTLYAALILIAFGWVADAVAARRQTPMRSRRHGVAPFATLAAAVAAFTVLVVMHDVEVAGSAYVPIVVDVKGLDAEALSHVTVSVFDNRRLATPLVRVPGSGTWLQPKPYNAAGIRVELPAAAAGLASLDVSMGATHFNASLGDPASWTPADGDEGVRRLESGPAISLPRSRVPRYGGPINWSGDDLFLHSVVRDATLPVALWMTFALVLAGAGRVLQSARLASADGWRPIALALLAIAGFSGEPLYVLNLRHQLYYGGVVGIVADTVGSLADGTLYDAAYSNAWRPWLIDFMWAALAIFAVAAVVILLRGGRRRLVAPGVIVTVMLGSLAGSVVARHFAQAPLPMGRTALFFLPLFTLLTGFTLDLVATAGIAARGLASAAGLALAAVAGLHLWRVTSFDATYEWTRDAQSRRVLADVERLAAADAPGRRRAVLGVDPLYSASTTYYALDATHPAIDVVVEPWPCDYLYVADHHDGSIPNVVTTYRISGAVLARAR